MFFLMMVSVSEPNELNKINSQMISRRAID